MRRIFFACLFVLVISPFPAVQSAAQEKVRVSEVRVTSKLQEEGSHPEGYNGYRAFDGRLDSAWVEGEEGPGIGEILKIRFGQIVEIDSVEIAPGFFISQYHRANNRVKKLRIVADRRQINFAFKGDSTELRTTPDARQYVLDFQDSMAVQKRPLEVSGIRDIAFVLEDIYPGTQWDDTCISEISFYRKGKKFELWFANEETERNDARNLEKIKNAIRHGENLYARELIPRIHNLDIDLVLARRNYQGPPEGAGGTPPDPDSVIDIAIRNGGPETAAALLFAGADPDRGLDTAVELGSRDFFVLLLIAGADYAEALRLSVWADNTMLAEIALEDFGADPNTEVTGQGSERHVILNDVRSAEMASLLIVYGADDIQGINGAGGPGDTPVLAAVRAERPDVLKVLLKKGFSPHMPEWGIGWSPLSLAEDIGNQEIIHMLRDAGAEK